MLPIEISFEWSLDFAKAVRRRHFSRLIRRPCIASLPIGIVGLVGVVCFANTRSAFGFLLLIVFSALPFLLWFFHYLATAQMQSKADLPRFSLLLEADSMTAKNDKATSTIKWAGIKSVWKFPDLIILFWDNKNSLKNSFPIPTSVLNEDTSRFIEGKVVQHGGKIC